MANIYPKEIYMYKGKQYNDIDQLAKQVEAEIGKIIDTLPLDMGAKQKLAVFNMLVANKKDIVELLSVTVEKTDGLYDASQSIFEYMI